MKTLLSSTMTTYIIIFVVVGVLIIVIFAAFLISKGLKSQNMKSSYHKIKIGMTREEVISMLGEPTSKGMNEDGSEILRWNLNEGAIQAAWDKDATRSVVVTIKEGKVAAYDGHNIEKRIW